MKILIVEDEFNSREGLAELIEKINCEYVVCGKAADGEQGLELAKTLQPDLIFVDIEMPKLSGLDMIEKILEFGMHPCFVVLSGYAEFKFAQKSIKLGVTQYLLKPITYEDLKNVLAEMKNKIDDKNAQNSLLPKIMQPEEILKSILLQSKEEAEVTYHLLTRKMSEQEKLFLINLYIGSKGAEEVKGIIQEIDAFKNKYRFTNCCYSLLEEDRFATIYITTDISQSEMIKRIKFNLLFSFKQKGIQDIVISLLCVNDSQDLESCLSRLQELCRWALVHGSAEILHDGILKKTKDNGEQYPGVLENEAILSLKNYDLVNLKKNNKKFINYLISNVSHPDKILEMCSSYIFSILVFLRGSNMILYGKIRNSGVLDDIKGCFTKEDVQGCFEKLVEQIQDVDEVSIDTNSLLVRKTVNYIKNNYDSRISLEELAEKMNVTPEYISHLFTKEIGKSFSSYVKEYRINLAKKLIMEGSLKLYEIGERVGYKDPKYFYKMFKEVTGISPKEYLIIHKI